MKSERSSAPLLSMSLRAGGLHVHGDVVFQRHGSGQGRDDTTLTLVACELSVRMMVRSTGVADGTSTRDRLGSEAILGDADLIPAVAQVGEIEAPLRSWFGMLAPLRYRDCEARRTLPPRRRKGPSPRGVGYRCPARRRRVAQRSERTARRSIHSDSGTRRSVHDILENIRMRKYFGPRWTRMDTDNCFVFDPCESVCTSTVSDVLPRARPPVCGTRFAQKSLNKTRRDGIMM